MRRIKVLVAFSILAYLCLTFTADLVTSLSPPGNQCPPGPEGPTGFPGGTGPKGYPGDQGPPGTPASSTFPPPSGTPCFCPKGAKGDDGSMGIPGRPGYIGELGNDGEPGIKGDAGRPGNPGLPGRPGAPITTHPPAGLGTLFVPVMFSGKVPQVVCHHFRRLTYVPGVPNKWIGWYEAAKSGYSSYNKWLYFSSRFSCPCSIAVPPGPTPSTEELLRRLLR